MILFLCTEPLIILFVRMRKCTSRLQRRDACAIDMQPLPHNCSRVRPFIFGALVTRSSCDHTKNEQRREKDLRRSIGQTTGLYSE